MLDDRAFPNGDLMREAGLYVPIPPYDELPVPRGRLDPSLAEIYRDHIKNLAIEKLEKLNTRETEQQKRDAFRESISEFRSTFSKCLRGDAGSLAAFPARNMTLLLYSSDYYGSTFPFHESLEYAIAAARAAQHIVLKRKFHRPPTPKPSRRMDDAEIRDLIRAEGDRIGKPVTLKRGAEIAMKADPAIRREKGRELTKSVYPDEGPGPKGPRNPAAE